MREIKFRGKRVDNGDWVEGFLADSISDNPCIMPKPFFATKDFGEIDENGNPILEDSIAIGGFYNVVPETVGQFTGLIDKNGKEIYEGDVLKTTYQYQDTFKEYIAVVEHDELNPCFVMVYKFQGNGHTCHEYDFVCVGLRKNEVIGNIHDNPELLK